MNYNAHSIYSYIYKNIVKKIFFLFEPEPVHNFICFFGEQIGKLFFIKTLFYYIFSVKSPTLKQKILNINFENPVGLAAGFDYNGKLTQILPSFNFGYETVGTITNLSYEGNPKPRLGRLPKSKSLMVNKGFKNQGAIKLSQKLSKLNFNYPLGISIGKTNSLELKNQKQSVDDIIKAFKIFEKAKVNNNYYELNISCPNLLIDDIEFYSPKNLDELLIALDKLNIKKPVFIKMPISETDKEVLSMLKVIVKHKIAGVIFGNLLKDRKNPALNKNEVNKFKKGNFSGKPTEKRSNELISLAYKKYKNKLIIIGCGGVFNAKDAYKKIKLGASLVQLITGLIYEGPLLPYEINKGLIELVKKDGFKNISEAVGKVI